MINKDKQYRQAGFAFDLDGTLINTEEHKAASHKKTIEYFGGTSSIDLYYKYIGNSFQFVFQKLKEHTSINVSLAQYQEKFNEFYFTELNKPLTPEAGAVKLLEKISSRGFKIALVTSSEKWMMNFIVDKIKMKKYFDVLVSGDDVKSNKPSPDPYLLAIKSLNSEKIFAFEDTKPGIISAQSAGAIVFGIKNDFNTPEDLSLAEKIYDNFNEFDLDKTLSSY